MALVICGLTLQKRVWLARFIKHNNTLPPGVRVKRDKIPGKVNKQFQGTGFTFSKLLHLYTHYKGQENFIKQTFLEDKKVKAEEASKARAKVRRKTESVKVAPAAVIEKPPKIEKPWKKRMAVQKPVVDAAPAEPTPASIVIPESPPAPTKTVVPIPPQRLSRHENEPLPPAFTRPRVKQPVIEDSNEAARQMKVTDDEAVTIARALTDWDPGIHTGSPFGFAALTLNERRLGAKRPLANADLVRAYVLGTKKGSDLQQGVTKFLSEKPVCKDLPDMAVQVAERVASYKPRTHP